MTRIKEDISSKGKLFFLLGLLACCLVPFLNKAFHIDDPIFIGMAKHIQAHPFDYYGFYMQFSPPVITNPPLIAYLIAVPGTLFGYSEFAIHTFFILPAMIVVLGTWLLALDMSADPFIASLATICTPVFILSSTTIMCDVPMLACWVLAIYFWRRGLKQGKAKLLAVSSLMITLCIFIKYMGICIIPLLIAYTIFEKRKISWCLLYLLLPIVTIFIFDQLTYYKYGLHQISFIESWSSYNKNLNYINVGTRFITALSFLGGCILVHFLYYISKIKCLHLIILFSLIVFVLLVMLENRFFDSFPVAGADGINWEFVAQLLIFVTVGVSFLHLTLLDFINNRDSDALLLFLWVLGVFSFAVFINWCVNGRTILPIVPAVGLLLARYCRTTRSVAWGTLYGSLIFSLCIALAVTATDTSYANSARMAAREIQQTTKSRLGYKWYEGHWGFEHYLLVSGDFALLDYEKPNLKKGDTVIVPGINTNTKPLFKHLAFVREVYRFDVSGLFSTMGLQKGAGFYADVTGPLPYALGSSPEYYFEYEIIVDKNNGFNY